MGKLPGNKVMTAAEAVSKYVSDGATVGMGGQSIGRGPTALAFEIVRQGKKDLTLVGCNLAYAMDVMVGAGAVARTEAGTGNMERFGTTFRWRHAIEQGSLEMEDYSHLSMALRFLAGSLGLPFMPAKSMLGTDILRSKIGNTHKPVEVIDNPWNQGEPVVLLPALNPDVSVIHAQKADSAGNVIIEGFTTHEPEMVKASKSVIVSCEELVSSDFIRGDPVRTTIPYIYVDAVVVQPWGAYPTSTYGHYEHDADHLKHYQAVAREGGQAYQQYLDRHVRGYGSFEEFLEEAAGADRLSGLRESMARLM